MAKSELNVLTNNVPNTSKRVRANSNQEVRNFKIFDHYCKSLINLKLYQDLPFQYSLLFFSFRSSLTR